MPKRYTCVKKITFANFWFRQLCQYGGWVCCSNERVKLWYANIIIIIIIIINERHSNIIVNRSTSRLQQQQKLLGMWESSVFQGRQPRPYPGGLGPGVPHILGPSSCGNSVWETATKFCMVIKVYVWKIFTRLTMPFLWPILLETWMLTRDLFVVATLLVVITQWLARQ